MVRNYRPSHPPQRSVCETKIHEALVEIPPLLSLDICVCEMWRCCQCCEKAADGQEDGCDDVNQNLQIANTLRDPECKVNTQHYLLVQRRGLAKQQQFLIDSL